jgi:N-formylglutamate deformylase
MMTTTMTMTITSPLNPRPAPSTAALPTTHQPAGADGIFTLTPGTSPLLVSMPHVGSFIPDAIRLQLVDRAFIAEDTDWHMDRLYSFAADLGASTLVPRHSRYVVDLNRPPENTPMYPGVNNTELCPTHFFTGEPLYRPGFEPDTDAIAARVATYWQPYHAALQAELARIRAIHGYALLFDAHSIKSELPWLFEGRLTDLNLGTVSGTSCAPSLRAAVGAVLADQSDFTQVVDGRFKGGYITRHYGRPAEHVHAIQLEMCWRTYMQESPPYAWAPEIAAGVQPLLRRLLQAMLDWGRLSSPHAVP